jgi:uncharacterized protein (DUF952 family)
MILATIYHLTTVGDWEAGKAAGAYTTSTRGKTLEDVGFLHGSQPHQVAPVANWLYKDTGEDLVVLVIDTGLLTSPWQYDDVPGQPDQFPHIYGPLNPDAVIEVIPLKSRPDGSFTFGDPRAGGVTG